MPLNPIKIRLLPLIESTTGTFFSQNWNLFAPNPVAQDYILLVQPISGDEPEKLTAGGWYNLSSPFWKRFQENRFSAYDRLARSQSSALRNTLSGDPSIVPLFDACNNGDSVSCVRYSESLKSIRETQIEKLVKIASAFCNDIENVNQHFTHVAVRIRIVTFPPWSKRYSEEETTIRDFDLGIHPIDKATIRIGLFN